MNEQVSLEMSLQKYFKYNKFRLGQKEIIKDVLKGNDVLGVLPTGSGKSLCYQLPAKLLEGTTIVVSPLISLMIDQVKELKAMNFKEVIALNSFMEYTERRKVYNRLATYKLIYISPELLQREEVLGYLKQLHINLFVIDEAHCISQWGHEFRPDYLKLNEVIKTLNNPPVLALSATATTNVQTDIITTLEKPNIINHIYPMDRENIAFCIYKVDNDQEKLQTIIPVLSTYNLPTLIYFSSRKATEKIASILSSKLSNKRIAFYHGGMEQMERITIQQQFMNDQLDIICCTSAFGMGINKNNIRLIIHYHFPAQIESYIQEVGRAGRDGASSTSILLHAENDEYLPARMIQNELPTEEELIFVLKQLRRLIDEEKELPTNDAEIENIFQVTEVQWRFLYYQFEKHGIISNKQLIVNEVLWERAFQKINIHRQERFILKQKKLTEMINWMNEEECLRKHLYKGFQSSYKEATAQCCSNCGFSLSKWKPEKITSKKVEFVNWQSKLQALLLNGGSHEAE